MQSLTSVTPSAARRQFKGDGHGDNANKMNVGNGPQQTPSAESARVRLKNPGTSEQQSERRPFAWLLGLRGYLGFALAGNMIWESLHLPLYTIWTTGSGREQAFAVVHCTLGDLLIAVSTLALALVLAGDHDWPRSRFWPVAILTIAFGVGYTAFSEWLNVVVRASWAYSDWMPVITVLGQQIGLSPLLQWIVVPATALACTKRWTLGAFSA
jgi:hypothetical protein